MADPSDRSRGRDSETVISIHLAVMVSWKFRTKETYSRQNRLPCFRILSRDCTGGRAKRQGYEDLIGFVGEGC